MLATSLCLSMAANAAGNFHFPVGIAYASGISDATDKLANEYSQEGYNVSKVNVPLGLVFDPYYEWQTSFGAIGGGLSLGPTALVAVDNSGYGTISDLSYAIPVGPFVRYTPWPDATVSPYVRGGFRYTFAGGSFESSDIGIFGAVGVDLWRNKGFGVSVEAGYDSSTLKVSEGSYSSNVSFPGFTVSLSVLF